MHMPVERRAKPVLEQDCSEPGTGLPDDAAAYRNVRRVAKQFSRPAVLQWPGNPLDISVDDVVTASLNLLAAG